MNGGCVKLSSRCFHRHLSMFVKTTPLQPAAAGGFCYFFLCFTHYIHTCIHNLYISLFLFARCGIYNILLFSIIIRFFYTYILLLLLLLLCTQLFVYIYYRYFLLYLAIYIYLRVYYYSYRDLWDVWVNASALVFHIYYMVCVSLIHLGHLVINLIWFRCILHHSIYFSVILYLYIILSMYVSHFEYSLIIFHTNSQSFMLSLTSFCIYILQQSITMS